MDLFKIIEKLYVSKDIKWINDVDSSEIEPFVIQKFLSMNDNIREQVRWLDKYVFPLPPKMWLSLAWSVLPKYDKMPFVRYIKKAEEEVEFDFILKEVRKQFKLSDNDYKHNKFRILTAIKNNMPEWFKYYGVPKKYWKEQHLNFDLIKGEEVKEIKQPKGLGAWGL